MEQAVNLVYTPKLKIPIGEAVMKTDGSPVLRVKNPRTHKYDEITLENLCEAVVQTASQNAQTGSLDGRYASHTIL